MMPLKASGSPRILIMGCCRLYQQNDMPAIKMAVHIAATVMYVMPILSHRAGMGGKL